MAADALERLVKAAWPSLTPCIRKSGSFTLAPYPGPPTPYIPAIGTGLYPGAKVEFAEDCPVVVEELVAGLGAKEVDDPLIVEESPLFIALLAASAE